MSRRLVHGVGINDAGYSVSTECNGRQVWLCPFYRAWEGMLRRCYSPALHAQRPTYKACSVAVEWHRFSVFRAWMTAQDWEGKALDKDILYPGNKRYSPDTCVFVSRSLNNFLIDSGAARGEWPLGVSLHRLGGKFRAECRNPITGKKDRIGVFSCPDQAHKAWLKRKHEISVLLAAQQKDPRVARALIDRYAAALTQSPKGEEE